MKYAVRKQAIRLWAIVAVSVLASACASGPKMSEVAASIPEIPAGAGRIYFYRESSMLGAAMQPEIQLNGEVVGSSVPGGFFFADRAPGSMEVTTTTEVEKKLTFILGAGHTRYVRTVIGFGVLVGRIYPELVDEATGAEELATASYIGPPL